jgi:hypothetical protein
VSGSYFTWLYTRLIVDKMICSTIFFPLICHGNFSNHYLLCFCYSVNWPVSGTFFTVVCSGVVGHVCKKYQLSGGRDRRTGNSRPVLLYRETLSQKTHTRTRAHTHTRTVTFPVGLTILWSVVCNYILSLCLKNLLPQGTLYLVCYK